MSHSLPLDFSLRNANDESVLILGGPQDLTLKLTNTSLTPLFLNPLTEAHHFSLRFRAGVLHDHQHIGADKGQLKHWDVDVKEDQGDVVVGLRRKTPMTWAPGKHLHVKLEGLRGESGGGTRATRVELSFEHIRDKDAGGALVTGTPRHHQMLLTMASSPLDVRGHPLLEAHFVGATGNVVLNDGNPHEYSIDLRLTNTTAKPLHIGPTTAFQVTLADGLEDVPGALATQEALQKYAVTASLVRDATDAPAVPLDCQPVRDLAATWQLRAPENIGPELALDPAAYLEIQIGQIVTRHRNGPSNVHVRWINLGYIDKEMQGEVVATLQKSPIIVAGGKIGIGTAKPAAALDVQGDLNVLGRITAPGNLEIDAPLKVTGGLVMGGVQLVARTFRDTQATKSAARHYTAEEFEAFEGWPTSLSTVNPLTFTFAFPSPSMSLLAARASVRLRVTAQSVNPPMTRGAEFASVPIPGIATVSGATFTVTIDLGKVVTIPDIPVQGGTKSLDISNSICQFPVADVPRLRDFFAEMSLIAGAWAHSFGRVGPNVCWTVEATCSATVLFADISDPS